LRYMIGLRKRQGGLAVSRTIVCATPAGVTCSRDIGLQGPAASVRRAWQQGAPFYSRRNRRVGGEGVQCGADLRGGYFCPAADRSTVLPATQRERHGKAARPHMVTDRAEYALVTDPSGRISGDAQINHFRAGLCVMGRGTPAIPATQSLISVQFRKSPSWSGRASAAASSANAREPRRSPDQA
jgi:hypothetical protein